MLAKDLIKAALVIAHNNHTELHHSWIKISHIIGNLSHAPLMASVQKAGELDLLLRTLEDEFKNSQPLNSLDFSIESHFYNLFSELWVSQLYGICRSLDELLGKKTNILPNYDNFKFLKRDLELARIGLEKYQITGYKREFEKLSKPIKMAKIPIHNASKDLYEYKEKDLHIMQLGFSNRHSIMWQVIDINSNQEYWVERRALAEQMITIFSPEYIRID